MRAKELLIGTYTPRAIKAPMRLSLFFAFPAPYLIYSSILIINIAIIIF